MKLYSNSVIEDWGLIEKGHLLFSYIFRCGRGIRKTMVGRQMAKQGHLPSHPQWPTRKPGHLLLVFISIVFLLET